MMLRPPKLLVGGTIGIVGPGSPMKPERLVKGIRYLERRGYRVKLGEHIRDVYGYLAGSDVDRARDFNAMFQDPAVDAIICTRGGYGTPRILHKIDYDTVAANPKILVGYSDITGLQLALFARTGLVTFSGPMAAVEMGKGIHAFTEENFWPLVTSTEAGRKLTGNAGPLRTIHAGTAEGTLLGGNLSLIAALTGTAFLPDLDGTILVIEDIGEEPYQIDRNLSQLRLAGVLQRIAGLVVGQMTDCEPDGSAPSLTIAQILFDLTTDLGIPVVTGLPYGHEDVKYTLPFGCRARLDAEEGNLQLLESGVV